MSDSTNATLPVPSAPIAGNLLVSHAWRYFFLQLFVRTGGSSGASIALLQAQIAALQGEVATLNGEVVALNTEVAALTTDVTTLTSENAALANLIVAGSVPL